MIRCRVIFIWLSCLLSERVLSQTPDYPARVLRIHENIEKHFHEKESGLYLETNGKNDKPFSFLWPLCAFIQAANEAEVLMSGTAFMKPVLNAISQYYNTSPPAPGYQAYLSKAGSDSRFYDDNQWIAIALLDAYNRTGEKSYLAKSEELYRFMMTGYDDQSGGGLYWKEDEKNTKNTCSNGPGILIALQLYKITKKKEYLSTALDLYQWTNKHLRDKDGIYWDAIRIPGLKLDSAKYTYNTGTMLQSNALLFQITQDKKYLDEAVFIAESAENFFYKNGKLPDHYWFNVVLLRGYEALYLIDGNKKRFQFFVAEAERIWKEERDASDLLGAKSKKGLIDQAAMMEMYARLQRLK